MGGGVIWTPRILQLAIALAEGKREKRGREMNKGLRWKRERGERGREGGRGREESRGPKGG